MEIKGWSWRETLTFCRSKGKADNFLRPDEVSHWGLEWMPKLLSSLHHSCQKNDLNQGVWISSCLFLYKLQGKLLVEKTTPVTSEPLISWWWPLLFTPTLPPKSNIRQQSKKMCAFLGGVNLTRLRKNNNKKTLFLPVCAAFDQLFQLGKLGVLLALLSSLTDEKQCALFHYTVNPISCFTLCRRVAERGDEWDGAGQCWHKSHNPCGNTSHQGHWGKVEGFWAINKSIKELIRPHLAIIVLHALLIWEGYTWLDKATKSYYNQEVTLGKSLPFLKESTLLTNNYNFTSETVDLHT